MFSGFSVSLCDMYLVSSLKYTFVVQNMSIPAKRMGGTILFFIQLDMRFCPLYFRVLLVLRKVCHQRKPLRDRLVFRVC